MNLDIWYNKLGIRVASRLSKRLKNRSQEIQVILEKSQIWVETQSSPQSPFKRSNLAKQSKNTQKKISNLSYYFQFYQIFLFCPKYFVRDCSFLKFKIHNYEKFPIYIYTGLVKQYPDLFDRFKLCVVCKGLLGIQKMDLSCKNKKPDLREVLKSFSLQKT